MYYPGKNGYVIIDSIKSGLGPPPDGNNGALNIDIDLINDAEGMSFDKWEIEATVELVQISNISSVGHKEHVPGLDGYTVKLSGPHNLGQLRRLCIGFRVQLYLGLSGSNFLPRIITTDLATLRSFIWVRGWVSKMKETVNAEGREDVEIEVVSDVQTRVLSRYAVQDSRNIGWPV